MRERLQRVVSVFVVFNGPGDSLFIVRTSGYIWPGHGWTD